MTKTNAQKIAQNVQNAASEVLTAKYSCGIMKWDESLHPRDIKGRFCAADGTGGGAGDASNVTTFGGASTEDFSKAVMAAKATLPDNMAWRVTAHTQEELEEEYPGAKLHITRGGSTVAVTADGDIISVCGKAGDTLRGRDLINLAIENGGTKLDAYSGLYGFYRKCGFEPVSWCKFDEQYAPDGWDKSRDEKEPVIFWKYTGNFSEKSRDELVAECADFCKPGTESTDYMTALEMRERSM